MRKFIFILASLAFCSIANAQTHYTVSVQPEKKLNGDEASQTINAKQGDPATPSVPAVNYYSINAVPTRSLDPNSVPAVEEVSVPNTSPKKTEPKSNPK